MRKKLHQSYFLVMFCIGIIFGTILIMIFRWPFFASPLWLLLAILLFVYTYFHPTYAFIVFALFGGILLAFFCSTREIIDQDSLTPIIGKTILVSGVVAGDPETDETKTTLKLTNLFIYNEFPEDPNSITPSPYNLTSALEPMTSTTPIKPVLQDGLVTPANTDTNINTATASTPSTKSLSGNLLASFRSNQTIARGDTLLLSGKLTAGFGTFSGALYRPKIIQIKKPEPGSLILIVRNCFMAQIFRRLPEAEAKLGTAYLLGSKSGLPEDLSTALRIVGLTHIVVASGAHLSILVGLTRKLFGKISRATSLLFSILFILFFMAMVGWTPSILRAGSMSILTILAWYSGRKFAPWRLILLVAAGTLLLNPMFLIDLGWLLSFASFTGIMILGPKIQKFFYGTTKPNFISATVITTIAATLLTLPISLYFFGTLSLISVLANLLILPTLPLAMGLTFLAGILNPVPILSLISSWLATKLLSFHIFVIEFLGATKIFLIQIEKSNPLVFLLYLPILAPFLIGYFRQKMLKCEKITGRNYVRTQQMGHYQTPKSRS